jgi:hypothetical protein
LPLGIERVYGPLFFVETTITSIVYLGMLQQFLIPQLDKMTKKTHSPLYLGEVFEYLSTRFPAQWIGRVAPIAWPRRSPDLTPLDFCYVDSFKIECLQVVELWT